MLQGIPPVADVFPGIPGGIAPHDIEMEIDLDFEADLRAQDAWRESQLMQETGGLGSMAKGVMRPGGRHTIVCKHWLRDLCMKGDKCDFLHQYDLARMPECLQWAKFGKCADQECDFRHDTERMECQKFKFGFCKLGAQCKMRHDKLTRPFLPEIVPDWYLKELVPNIFDHVPRLPEEAVRVTNYQPPVPQIEDYSLSAPLQNWGPAPIMEDAGWSVPPAESAWMAPAESAWSVPAVVVDLTEERTRPSTKGKGKGKGKGAAERRPEREYRREERTTPAEAAPPSRDQSRTQRADTKDNNKSYDSSRGRRQDDTRPDESSRRQDDSSYRRQDDTRPEESSRRRYDDSRTDDRRPKDDYSYKSSSWNKESDWKESWAKNDDGWSRRDTRDDWGTDKSRPQESTSTSKYPRSSPGSGRQTEEPPKSDWRERRRERTADKPVVVESKHTRRAPLPEENSSSTPWWEKQAQETGSRRRSRSRDRGGDRPRESGRRRS